LVEAWPFPFLVLKAVAGFSVSNSNRLRGRSQTPFGIMVERIPPRWY
jgi:hypothetical protein